MGIAWGALVAAEDRDARARRYVLDRRQFGRPLAANQLVRKRLADMPTEITPGLQGARGSGALRGGEHRRGHAGAPAPQ